MNDHESQLADTLSNLETHADSVIALLELFAQNVPAGLPAEDDGALVRIGAYVETAVNALRKACETNTIVAYENARKTARAMLFEIEENLSKASQETAALLFGLVWAIQAFLAEHYLLPSEPPDGEPIAQPEGDTQAAEASDAADDDVLEVIGDMIIDLAPIETMAGMLVDQTVPEIDEEQLRAMATAVHVMVRNLCGNLISDHEQRQKARAAL